MEKLISIKLDWLQKEGIDYEDTFAPLAKLNTIRLMIALGKKHNWEMC